MSDLPVLAVEVARLAVWLAGLAAVFVPLERLFAARPAAVFRKGAGTDLAYFFLSGLVPAVLLGLPLGAVAWAVRAVVPGELLEATAALPLWAAVPLGLVVGEVGYYWGHRLCHHVPFLWRFHAVHHSAEQMDFLVNTRAHPVDLVFGRLCALVPLMALGLGGPGRADGATVPVLVSLIGTGWGFFIHANVRWRFGPLEWLVSTPAFHHWHHTKSGPIDRNFASTLPWLDRLFGTHHLPAGELPAEYGVTEAVPDQLVDQFVYPLFPPVARGANDNDRRSGHPVPSTEYAEPPVAVTAGPPGVTSSS